MGIVTVSRELGAGGAYIALKLAQALSYQCVDKEIIHEITQKMGKSEDDLKDFDQDTYNRIAVFFEQALESIAQGGRVLHPFGIGPLDWNSPTLFHSFPEGKFEHDEYGEVLKQVVNELASKDKVVILGRGAVKLLEGNENVFHLRIVAELKDRVTRFKDEQQIDESKALENVNLRDECARKFFEDFFDVDWADPHLYHLTLNTSKIPLDDCVSLALHAFQNKISGD